MKQLEDAVFYAAINVADPAERQLFVDQACVGDPTLRGAVDQMLAAYGGAEQFFAKGRLALSLPGDEIQAAIGEISEQEAIVDEPVGTRIGPL